MNLKIEIQRYGEKKGTGILTYYSFQIVLINGNTAETVVLQNIGPVISGRDKAYTIAFNKAVNAG